MSDKLIMYVTSHVTFFLIDPEQLLAIQDMLPDEEAMMNLAIALSLVMLHDVCKYMHVACDMHVT